jgi:hypothetical protein
MPGLIRRRRAGNLLLDPRAPPLYKPITFEKQSPLSVYRIFRNNEAVLPKIIRIDPGRHRDCIGNINGRHSYVITFSAKAPGPINSPLDHSSASRRPSVSISTRIDARIAPLGFVHFPIAD